VSGFAADRAMPLWITARPVHVKPSRDPSQGVGVGGALPIPRSRATHPKESGLSLEAYGIAQDFLWNTRIL
jgi:hypothetical protein